MAALAGDLSKAILGHSDAEKAFRPWWDVMEDSMMYFFVVMSMVTLPMTFLSNTPLDCTIHHSLWPTNFTSKATKIPSHTRFVQSYAKKYCSEAYISPFLLYLPFTLLLGPMALTACEKIFIGIFKTEKRLEQFYSLLIKDSLDREDVNSLEKENVRDLHEIRQAFRNSSACYKSYLYRTVSEIIMCISLMVFFLMHNDIIGFLHPLFDCDVHGLLYQCVVPNTKFFFVVHFLSIMALVVYLISSAYNFLWILHPRDFNLAFNGSCKFDDKCRMNALRRLLHGCQRISSSEYSEYSQYSHTTTVQAAPSGDRPKIRLDLYFDKKSMDFGLLMDLLAEASGIVQSLRILSMFDRQFQKLWKASNVQINIVSQLKGPDQGESDREGEEGSLSILVTWGDCDMADYFCRHNPGTVLEYTAEISPDTEIPIKSFQYYKSLNFLPDKKRDGVLTDKSERLLDNESHSLSKYRARFDGLVPGTSYDIHIATELDGKTVVQTKHTIKTLQSDPDSDKKSVHSQKQ